jgi:glycosyltransferase involved in cell wall biosynthesis
LKVAHINCLISTNRPVGVEKKLADRAKAISRLGLDMDVLYFNFERFFQGNEVAFFRRRGADRNRLLSALARYSCISKHVDTDQYDLLVLRYSGGDLSVFSRFFRNNEGKIVTEHQTKELPEAWTYKATLVQKMITLGMEKYVGPRLIRRCAGLIANCDDVRVYELERAGVNIPSCSIPDGICVEDIPFSKSAPYKGTILNLLCLSTKFETWQGLDRVLAGLERYSSKRPFVHLLVVGDVFQKDLEFSSRLQYHANVKVDFLGRLYGRKLEEVFEGAHIAFGPLAMFRKDIRDGSAIKTREFTARGLPFVIGHDDPDLQGAQEFCLSISADDSPVNMDDVVEFAECVLRRDETSAFMREFAHERLDLKVKMKQMWDFLESLLPKKNVMLA